MFGRNHIVISSDKYLAELYKSIGFQETEFNFVQPKYRNLNMKVLVMTDLTTKCGKGMHPVDWWRIWGNVSLYLYRRRVIRYSLAERFRIYGSCFLYHCSVTSKPLLDRLKRYCQAKRSTLLLAVK